MRAARESGNPQDQCEKFGIDLLAGDFKGFRQGPRENFRKMKEGWEGRSFGDTQPREEAAGIARREGYFAERVDRSYRLLKDERP